MGTKTKVESLTETERGSKHFIYR